MTVNYIPNFQCDACGEKGQGLSASIYSLPPRGWLWTGTEGPHACGVRCWGQLASAHYARTQQHLAPISHEDSGAPLLPAGAPVPEGYEAEEVEEEEVLEAVPVEEAPPAPRAAPRPVQAAAPKPKPTAAPKPATAKVVPLGASGVCADCGAELPPPRGGRPRTRCDACSPPRTARG